MPLRLRSSISELLTKYRDIKIASGIKDVSIDRYISYIDDFYFEYGINQMIYTKELNS